MTSANDETIQSEYESWRRDLREWQVDVTAWRNEYQAMQVRVEEAARLLKGDHLLEAHASNLNAEATWLMTHKNDTRRTASFAGRAKLHEDYRAVHQKMRTAYADLKKSLDALTTALVEISKIG